jgi:hypothetical protein
VHYFADTPDGAWAELVRHEEIRDPEDLAAIRRMMWAIELPERPEDRPELKKELLTGGLETYPTCRREAARLRAAGAQGFRAPSAALLPGGATGWVVQGGLQPAAPRDGEVLVLFGVRPDLIAWRVAAAAPPPDDLLGRVRHL